MDNIPLPVQRPAPSIDGQALMRAFLESDTPQLPTDPDEIAAFAEALNEAVASSPDIRDARRPAELTQAHDSIRTKSARARGGKVGDGGFGGIIDDVADFIAGPAYDSGAAIMRGINDGSTLRTLGGLGLLATTLVPGLAGVGRGFSRTRSLGDDVYHATKSLNTSAHNLSQTDLAKKLANAEQLASSLRRGIDVAPSAKLGAGLGAGSSTSYALSEGETDPAALASAALLGGTIGIGADRAGANIGRAAGINDSTGGGALDFFDPSRQRYLQQNIATTGDLLEAQIPAMRAQTQASLEAGQRLQTRQAREQIKQRQHQASRRRPDPEGGARDASTRELGSRAATQPSMLALLASGDTGQLAAPQTYGTLSPNVTFTVGNSLLRDIGKKPVQTKTGSPKDTLNRSINLRGRSAENRERRSVDSARTPNAKQWKPAKEAAQNAIAEIMKGNQASKRVINKKTRPAITRIAREHGVPPAELGKYINRWWKSQQ